jgi:calcineurin-like phosphoesterase family protein
MSKILDFPNLGRYQISDHNGYHKKNAIICIEYQDLIDVEKVLIPNYNIKVNQEDTIFKYLRKGKNTEKKAMVDHERDDTLLGTVAITKANLRHFDPATRDAEAHINNLIANYGDVVHASYDAETTAIDSIIARLRSEDYIEDIKLLSLTSWIDHLYDLNTQFKQYVEETALEEMNKPNISPKESRLQTDRALKEITTRVEALANLNGKDDYMPFARKFNELTNHYNQLVREHYGRIHVRFDISSAYIAPIFTQAFTGKPIFVIPDVKFTKTTNEGIAQIVDLVFTEDFTVSYKNNTKQGTATIRIQGVGKYKGEIVTTFNIE